LTSSTPINVEYPFTSPSFCFSDSFLSE